MIISNSNFFNHIFNIYSKIKILKKNKNFFKLDTIYYYLADEINSSVQASNLYEIDIKSAFPSICQYLFENEKDFLDKLNNLKDKKLERNIFISTTLKNTEYLKQLNLISKMIISSILMDADLNANVFELKKDGILYSGQNIENRPLYNYFVNELNFNIHIKKIDIYYRFQKTSHYYQKDENQLVIKGVYKDRPDFLIDILKQILSSSFMYNKNDEIFDTLLKIYSKKYFKIIQINNLDEVFRKYYVCTNNKYLNNDFKYERIKMIHTINNIQPQNYLKLFIYPFLINN